MRRFSDSFKIENNYFDYTVKPVFNDHPLDPKCVAVVDRWSLFRGRFMLERPKYELVVAVGRWSLPPV
jgi:hypothetical protein